MINLRSLDVDAKIAYCLPSLSELDRAVVGDDGHRVTPFIAVAVVRVAVVAVRPRNSFFRHVNFANRRRRRRCHAILPA